MCWEHRASLTSGQRSGRLDPRLCSALCVLIKPGCNLYLAFSAPAATPGGAAAEPFRTFLGVSLALPASKPPPGAGRAGPQRRPGARAGSGRFCGAHSCGGRLRSPLGKRHRGEADPRPSARGRRTGRVRSTPEVGSWLNSAPAAGTPRPLALASIPLHTFLPHPAPQLFAALVWNLGLGILASFSECRASGARRGPAARGG